MIRFTAKGKQLRVGIDSDYGGLGACWWECENDTVSRVMRDHYTDRLFNLVQAIREEAYEEGYRNGRSKKRKKKYFSGHL